MHEKEEKLIIMMRMNGMRMREYWLIVYLFNLAMSLITFFLFFCFGYYVLELVFFTETDYRLIVKNK